MYRIKGGMRWRVFGRGESLTAARAMKVSSLPALLARHHLESDGAEIIDPDGKIVREGDE